MQDSKLIEALKSLQARELTAFLEYVCSDYFNKHQQIRTLALYLARFAPEYEHSTKLDKEAIFEHIYPQMPYDDGSLHSLFSKLLRLLYEFMSHRQWEQDRWVREVYLLQQLRRRKITDKHQTNPLRHLHQIEQSEQKKPETEQTLWHWGKYLYHREMDAAFIAAGGRSQDTHLQAKNDHLDAAYFVEKLKIACDMLSRSVVTQSNYEPTFLPNLLTYLDTHQNENLSQHFAVQIYRCILDTVRDSEQIGYYWQLKSLLLRHYAQFSKDEAMNIYGYALNYCIRKINGGQTAFFQEVWEHYQLLVETKIIYINGYLPHWEYKQIVTTALRLGKNAWAQEFVERYRMDLEPDMQYNAYGYNIASIHYANKNYRAALLALHDVKFADTTYELGSRILQVKAYYELNEVEPLRSLIEAFLVYVRRSKDISAYRKEANTLFLRLTRKLFQLKEQKRFQYTNPNKLREKLRAFQLEVEGATPVANKDWIQAELQKLLF